LNEAPIGSFMAAAMPACELLMLLATCTYQAVVRMADLIDGVDDGVDCSGSTSLQEARV
jgi:hypothetical protein